MRRILLGAAVPVMLVLSGCSNDTTDPGNGSPVTINWSPCINDPSAPAWFAFQDGTGSWTRVSSTNGVFTFTASSGKIGVATYSDGQLSIVYATSAEMNTFRPNCTGSRRTVTGSVTGYAALDKIDIEMGGGSTTLSPIPPGPTAFTLTDVAPGAADVLAVRYQSSVTSSAIQTTPSAVFIRRAQSNTPLAVIDMNSPSEGGAPQSKTVTISGAKTNETLVTLAGLNTPTTGIVLSEYTTGLGTVTGNVSALFYGIPGSRLTGAETQSLLVATVGGASTTNSDIRYVTVVYADATDKVVTLGSNLGTVTVSGTSRPSALYTIQAGYDQAFVLSLEQGSTRSIDVTATRGYIGATATAASVAVPDLSGATGFQSSWLLTPGTSATWTFFATSATLGNGNLVQAYTAASRSGTLVP